MERFPGLRILAGLLIRRFPMPARCLEGFLLSMASVFVAALLVDQARAGCEGGPEFSPSTIRVLEKGHELGQGLSCLVYGRKTIVTSDGRRRRFKSVIGEFEDDGRRIRFETLRGPRTPRVLRKTDREAPRYEIDVRFLSDEGTALEGQVGGCCPVDPSWEIEEPSGWSGKGVPAAVSDSPDPQADFARIARMIDALVSHPFASPLRPEYQAVVGQHAAVQEAMFPVVIEPSDDAEVEEDPVAGMSRIAVGYRHVIRVFESRVFRIYPAATHAATLFLLVNPSGYVEKSYNRGNHGRRYFEMSGSSLDRVCTWASAFVRSSHLHRQSCNTAYNPFSFSGTHNCNDDAATQAWTVRSNRHADGVSGVCSDPYRHDLTDRCF